MCMPHTKIEILSLIILYLFLTIFASTSSMSFFFFSGFALFVLSCFTSFTLYLSTFAWLLSFAAFFLSVFRFLLFRRLWIDLQKPIGNSSTFVKIIEKYQCAAVPQNKLTFNHNFCFPFNESLLFASQNSRRERERRKSLFASIRVQCGGVYAIFFRKIKDFFLSSMSDLLCFVCLSFRFVYRRRFIAKWVYNLNNSTAVSLSVEYGVGKCMGVCVVMELSQ